MLATWATPAPRPAVDVISRTPYVATAVLDLALLPRLPEGCEDVPNSSPPVVLRTLAPLLPVIDLDSDEGEPWGPLVDAPRARVDAPAGRWAPAGVGPLRPVVQQEGRSPIGALRPHRDNLLPGRDAWGIPGPVLRLASVVLYGGGPDLGGLHLGLTPPVDLEASPGRAVVFDVRTWHMARGSRPSPARVWVAEIFYSPIH